MIPWTDSVRQSGKLTISIGTLAGTWGHVFREALHEFNVLSAAYKLGVTITESKPAADDKAGANVSVQTGSGPISASYDNQTKAEDFDGGRLHGRTLLFWRDPGNVVEKGFIFLPSQPRVNTPRGQRPVGAGVMKVIAAHELLHACGLEDADHSGDLFQANPRVNPGDSAAGDKVLIGTGPKSMPPLVLDGATTKNIKDLWTK
jgi:hypothetical protein